MQFIHLISCEPRGLLLLPSALHFKLCAVIDLVGKLLYYFITDSRQKMNYFWFNLSYSKASNFR